MGTLALVFYLVVLTFLAIFNIYKLHLLFTYLKYKNRKIKPKSIFKDLPVVTVQLPVYNEKYVLERLVINSCRIEYPREKLEIQILDDSTDTTVTIAQRLTKKLLNLRAFGGVKNSAGKILQ